MYARLTHRFTLWGILGIRARLYCRQHVNKMFHFPLSGLAVCMKTAPVLPRSFSSLSFHLRLPHFSLLLLTCFHLRGATKRKRKTQVCTRVSSKMREEKKAGWCFHFTVFLCLLSSVSPESGAAGVSFRVDTGTRGTLSLLPGKTCEELFYQTGPMENPSFSIAFVFILKTCRW